jgi:hypothetical protein
MLSARLDATANNKENIDTIVDMPIPRASLAIRIADER